MSNIGPNNAFSSPLAAAQRDRRQFPRIHVKWQAAIQFAGATANVTVIEISDVGFGFMGDIAYKIDAQLAFQLNMPDPVDGSRRHQVTGYAEVMSTVLTRDGFRIGVTLKTISSSHRELLQTWVKLRMRE